MYGRSSYQIPIYLPTSLPSDLGILDPAPAILMTCQDATLKRCFGVNKYVIDCDWAYLKTLRTLKEPHDRMPRLVDVLEYLASPGLEEIWLLLDIKVRTTRCILMLCTLFSTDGPSWTTTQPPSCAASRRPSSPCRRGSDHGMSASSWAAGR